MTYFGSLSESLPLGLLISSIYCFGLWCIRRWAFSFAPGARNLVWFHSGGLDALIWLCFIFITLSTITSPVDRPGLSLLYLSMLFLCPTVYIVYILVPDRLSPILETLKGIDNLYREGVFEQFCTSNSTAKEVEEVVKVA